MSKRRNGRAIVLEALRAKDNQTIAEIVAMTKLSKEGVRDSLICLMERGQIHRLAEKRKFATFESHVYAFGPGEPQEEPEEPLTPVRERTKAIQESLRTVQTMYASYIPGQFDPFRVLRVQVGA